MPLKQKLQYILFGTAQRPKKFKEKIRGIELLSPRRVTLEPGEKETVDTLVVIRIPDGKSSVMQGLPFVEKFRKVIVEPAVLNSEIRETIKVVMRNVGNECIRIESGEPIAQLIVTNGEKFSLRQERFHNNKPESDWDTVDYKV